MVTVYNIKNQQLTLYLIWICHLSFIMSSFTDFTSLNALSLSMHAVECREDGCKSSQLYSREQEETQASIALRKKDQFQQKKFQSRKARGLFLFKKRIPGAEFSIQECLGHLFQ